MDNNTIYTILVQWYKGGSNILPLYFRSEQDAVRFLEDECGTENLTYKYGMFFNDKKAESYIIKPLEEHKKYEC